MTTIHPYTKIDTIVFGINKKSMDDLTVSNEIKNSSSTDLIDYMAMKTEFPEQASEAFEVFCLRFQGEVFRMAEIACNKWNYNETVALDIVNCTFERVWKYPSFNPKKSKASDENKGIQFWLNAIVMTQLANQYNNGTCHEPTDEEDLSIITSTEELIDYTCSGDVERKKDLRQMLDVLEKGLALLDEKHRIIYLTYKAYEKPKKRVPRSVLEKLRITLNLTQSSVKVYKNEAYKTIENYLNNYGK